MKVSVKNFQIGFIINLCNALYPQRMLIGDKLKIKENYDKLLKKQNTLDELRKEIILSNGGTLEEGIKKGDENFEKCIGEINDLFNLDVEISISPIKLEVLEKFEADNIDLDSVLILSGTYALHVAENIGDDTKEISFTPEKSEEEIKDTPAVESVNPTVE